MLYNYLVPFAEDYGFLNLFRYITFRTGGALMTAIFLSFLFGPRIISWLRSKQKKGQPIREDGPQRHIVEKQGTPTMGGFLILLSMSISTFLWADLANPYVWVVMGVTLGFGLVGFVDDYMKVTGNSSGGFSGKIRLALEMAIAGTAAYVVMGIGGDGFGVPFAQNTMIALGAFYVPMAMFVIVGAGNAVNLTDGLDGLATMPVIIAAAAFALIAYLVGNAVYAGYLGIPNISGAGEMAVFLGALIGAGLGFLWYNAPPAMVFMGDTGSLSLGGALGTVAVITRHELVLAIVGGLFVLETVSVIVQVASYKLTGKRVFRMAPIHHHFEEKGWAEPTIVIRFWIIAVILALIGLSTLKLR